MTGDDDLIFTDTAEEATRKDVSRPTKTPKLRRPETTETGRFPAARAAKGTAPVRKPPEPEVAQRPHVLISPVLAEPLMLSRTKLYLVGRDEEADIRIRTDKVSRAHAEIEWDGKCFVVRDLDSTNGSQLNDKPLKNMRTPLYDNDRLSFGGYEVLVNVLAPGEFPDLELGGRTKRMKIPRNQPPLT